MLSLKQALQHFIDHRRDVVTRRTLFELREARERQQILEGLEIAVDNIDAVIDLIRSSKDTETAKTRPDAELRAVGAPGAGDPRHAPRQLTGLEREKLDRRDQGALARSSPASRRSWATRRC